MFYNKLVNSKRIYIYMVVRWKTHYYIVNKFTIVKSFGYTKIVLKLFIIPV